MVTERMNFLSLNNDIYIAALKKVSERRIKAERRTKSKQKEIYSAHPDVKQLESDMNSFGIRAVRAAAGGDKASAEVIHAQYEDIEHKYLELIKKYNLSSDDFEVQYECRACSDTGYIGAEICPCVHDLAKNEISSRMSGEMPLNESTFEDFSLEHYPDNTENGVNVREHMRSLYNFCMQYAKGFSHKSPNLLFLGATGLGKTHLSLAIASSAISYGYSVIYGSAQDFFHSIERQHFHDKSGANRDTLENLLATDLLILDDLGTEFLTSFVVSTVYNIINTRMLHGKATIINSNLSLAEIETRYTARISSRLIGGYTMKRFLGNDVRQILTLKKK